MANKTRCPECNSTQCYHREKTKDFICQKCGHVWPIPKHVLKE